MRKALSDLINSTIIYQYSLPNIEKKIQKVHFSTECDRCYAVRDNSSLIELIYNSIIDYSFDEFSLTMDSYKTLLAKALKIKLKFNDNASQTSKLKYGFYGEVLLYSLLHKLYGANCLISRGYFYNPLENEETKGYDAYHIIENIKENVVELWFGEVKFHIKHDSAVRSVMTNINKALSDKYLETNILAMVEYKDKIKDKNSKIKAIIEKWESNPEIKIVDELKNNNMILIYPIYIIFDMNKYSYDDCIKTIVKYIKDNYQSINPVLTIDYKLFFIFMPIQNVKQVKEEVLKWIEEKKPVLL